MNSGIFQLKMEILDKVSLACRKIIYSVIQQFKDHPNLDVPINLNFVMAYYDIAYETLYTEEISECRDEEGEIIGIIGTIYVFKKKLDTVYIPDDCIGKVTAMNSLDHIFSLKPHAFKEIYSSSASLLFYPEDLKILGRKKKPILN